MFINFSDIPSHQNLFLDYLYEFGNVKDFYKYNFRNREEYLKIFKEIAESRKKNRSQIAEIIQNQYKDINHSQKTSENIDSLKSDKTLAVVTGQQLGIMGGPLYTFYKIITAIKLADSLSERYDEYKFVPIFWLESDDHDFNEVRSIKLVNEGNELVKISYGDETEEEDSRLSVGYIKFDEKINLFFDELDKALRDTEFKGDLLGKLKSFYAVDKTFKTSFIELIHWLFDEYGLIIFDPQSPEVKQKLKPIFKKEITDFRQHTERLVKVSATLEETYHAQVKVQPVNLFFSTDDGRYAIEPVENEFRLKRKRRKFTFDELTGLVETEPERFSANVLLRPICQDFLLPTAFYIGGPSEISYFAQVTPLYEIYGMTPPIIYPRSSVTILEKNINSIIEKYNLNFPQVFSDPEELKTRVIVSLSKISLDDLFNNSINQMELIFDKLKEELFEFDKTISDASTKYKQKIYHDMEVLKSKALDAQKKKHEVTLRQIDKISQSVFPYSDLQERELNFIHFFNKYGSEILKKIFEELAVNKFEHQIIKL